MDSKSLVKCTLITESKPFINAVVLALGEIRGNMYFSMQGIRKIGRRTDLCLIMVISYMLKHA